MSALDGNHLGDSQLGSSKLGPVSQQPGDLDAGRGPRDRFDSWVKSAFPTGPGTTWDEFLNTLADEFESELSVRQNIYYQQYVDTASRAQLEKLGALLGVERRQGEVDAHYRRRIKLQIPKYTTGATINELLQLSAALLDCDPENIELVESFDIEPARFDIFLADQIISRSSITVSEFLGLIQDVKAGGVRANATIGAQFTYRSEYEFRNNINDPDRAYGGLGPDAPEGAPYADLITARHRGPDDRVEVTPDIEGYGEGQWGGGIFGGEGGSLYRYGEGPYGSGYFGE